MKRDKALEIFAAALDNGFDAEVAGSIDHGDERVKRPGLGETCTVSVRPTIVQRFTEAQIRTLLELAADAGVTVHFLSDGSIRFQEVGRG